MVWVTEMVRVIPPAVTVTVPVRGVLVLLLASAVIVIVRFPVPLAGVTESQLRAAAFTDAFQFVLESTLNVAWLRAAGAFQRVVETSNTGFIAACVTMIMRVGAPGAVMVIIPVRGEVVGFLCARILKVPLPLRLAGMKLPTVSQLVALLVAVHVPVVVTLTMASLASDGGVHDVAFSERLLVRPDCVT